MPSLPRNSGARAGTALVSVVIPVHNAAEHLQNALESLRHEDDPGLDILVVDDGSTDGTSEVLRSWDDPRLRMVSSATNAGVAAALNLGLSNTAATYVARMDADDLWVAGRLRRQVAYLDAHPSVAVVGTQFRYIGDHGRRRTKSRLPTHPDAVRWHLLFDNAIAHPTAMMRRDAVLSVGGFRPQAVGAEDFDLWTRLWPDHALANLRCVGLHYRWHGGNESVTRYSQAEATNVESVNRLIRTLLDREVDPLVLAVARGRVSADAAGVNLDALEAVVDLLAGLRGAVSSRFSPQGMWHVDEWMARRLARIVRSYARANPVPVRRLRRLARGLHLSAVAAGLGHATVDAVVTAASSVPRRARDRV